MKNKVYRVIASIFRPEQEFPAQEIEKVASSYEEALAAALELLSLEGLTGLCVLYPEGSAKNFRVEYGPKINGKRSIILVPTS